MVTYYFRVNMPFAPIFYFSLLIFISCTIWCFSAPNRVAASGSAGNSLVFFGFCADLDSVGDADGELSCKAAWHLQLCFIT